MPLRVEHYGIIGIIPTFSCFVKLGLRHTVLYFETMTSASLSVVQVFTTKYGVYGVGTVLQSTAVLQSTTTVQATATKLKNVALGRALSQ